MFQEGVLLTFVLFYISSNCKCESTIDIPLITKLDAPLKAELDITALTKQLKSLISEEIKRYVGNAEDDYTGRYRQGLQSDIFNVTGNNFYLISNKFHNKIHISMEAGGDHFRLCRFRLFAF